GQGGEGFFRISFIQSAERIAEAARRAGEVLRAMIADLASVGDGARGTLGASGAPIVVAGAGA
ncbi:MAG: hypothetical protein IT354_09540, partial [Gemmatimonadaceae bacterium]|nr:hypothetical protein [Gemmatimonadaceae bacterium]